MTIVVHTAVFQSYHWFTKYYRELTGELQCQQTQKIVGAVFVWWACAVQYRNKLMRRKKTPLNLPRRTHEGPTGNRFTGFVREDKVVIKDHLARIYTQSFLGKMTNFFWKMYMSENISGVWKKLLFGAEVIRTTKLAKNNKNEHKNNLW